MKIPICPQLNVRKEIAFTLVGGCYFFLLLSSPCLSMYDKAAKTTNNRVSTSIVFMGITLLCKTRGHLTIGKSHPLSFRLHNNIITQIEQMFNSRYGVFRCSLSIHYEVIDTALSMVYTMDIPYARRHFL